MRKRYPNPINYQIRSYGNLNYEDDEWMIFLRDHINAGIIQDKAIPETVKPIETTRFSGDFYAYLRYKNKPAELDLIHLKLNHFNHPTEWGEGIKTVLLLPDGLIDEWYNRYQQYVKRR